MAHSGSILVVKKGLLPPMELVATLLKDANSVGAAFVVKEGRLQLNHWKTAPNIDQIMKGMDVAKDMIKMFYFGRFPHGFLSDDNQPFEVLSHDKHPLLVACVDGDFASFAQPNSKHSNAFHYFAGKVRPNVDMLAAMAITGDPTKDISKLTTALKAPIQAKNFLPAGERGVLCFLSSTGEVIPLTLSNPHGLEADWGWCSNVYDYGKSYPAKAEEVEEDEEEEKPKEVEEDDEPGVVMPWEDKPTETKPTETKPPANEKLDPEVGTALFELDPKKSMVRPSIELKSKNDLQKWYRRNFGGFLPNDFMGKPWRSTTELGKDSPVFKVLMTQGLDKKLGVRFPVLKTLQELPTKDILSAPKVEGSKMLPTKGDAGKPDVKTPQGVPIIGAKAKEALGKSIFTKEFFDRMNEKIRDPSTVQADEKKFGTFSSQMKSLGIAGLESTFKWEFNELMDIGTVDLKTVVLLCLEYKNKYLSELASKMEVDEVELLKAFA